MIWFFAGAFIGASLSMLSVSWWLDKTEALIRQRKGKDLDKALEEAWGGEESDHWMREWCPGCEHMWEPFSEDTGTCEQCCWSRPEHPDRPEHFSPLDIGFTEEAEEA